MAKWIYRPVLNWSLRHPVAVTLGAAAGFLACIPLALGLGGEFIPQLDEGDLIIAQMRPPSASLQEGIADAERFEKALKEEFPDEIRTVIDGFRRSTKIERGNDGG